MIRSIQRLKDFGIFADYSKTLEVHDFAEVNLLYGWNYSGKTTLSRLFNIIGTRKISADFTHSRFSLLDSAGSAINETSLSTCTKVVEVFNSDFVRNNIDWNGEAFQPILLLGEDSVEAEQKISALDERVKHLRQTYSAKQSASAAIDQEIASAKTSAARRIKTDLRIVDAYSATHLSSDIAKLPIDVTSAQLGGDRFAKEMKLALTSDNERLPKLAKFSVHDPILTELWSEAATLVRVVPPMTSTIEHLRDDPTIAQWVERGLNLHDQKTVCEFCENQISATRFQQLRGHFSRDLTDHKLKIENLLTRVRGAKLQLPGFNEVDVAPQFREPLKQAIAQLGLVILSYNNAIQELDAVLVGKRDNPFQIVTLQATPVAMASAVVKAFKACNEVVGTNNELADAFEQNKREAIQRLRHHFAASFKVEEQLDRKYKKQRIFERHKNKIKTVAASLKVEIEALNAKVNRSHKGRERLNQLITSLLGTGNIEIGVIKVGEDDRFQLLRGGSPAKNLSDGERTAIAFAFFLTKLEEHERLAEVIVYVDDPVSSLDSNHVFQVFSLIHATFFKKVQAANGGEEWMPACRQLFVSTHNFEFFELLKKQPCSKKKTRYHLVKRTGTDTSVLLNLPASLLNATSEYHYLFGIIYSFHKSDDKADVGQLLMLPNALRRFLELYTYMKLPIPASTVEQRAEKMFGRDKSLRIVKLLHHFSHLESAERVAANSNLIADIGAVINQTLSLISEDTSHYQALVDSLSVAPEAA